MGHGVIVVTGASSGFGRLNAEALALAGHTVYASMRDTTGRNASQVEAVGYFAKDNGVELRTVEMDVDRCDLERIVCAEPVGLGEDLSGSRRVQQLYAVEDTDHHDAGSCFVVGHQPIVSCTPR